MSKMGRLIRGELNKILMRPILYVITGILVIALILALTIYAPEQRADSEYAVGGSTNTEAYTNFSTRTGEMNKIVADENVTNAVTLVEYYKSLGLAENKYTSQLSLVDEMQGIMSTYSQSIFNEPNVTNMNNNRLQLINTLNQFRTIFNNAVNAPNLSILITTDSIDEISTLVENAIRHLSTDGLDYNDASTHLQIYNYLASNRIIDDIITLTHQIKDIEISEQTITNLNTLLATATANLEARAKTINENYPKADYELEQLKDDIRSYYLYSDHICNLVSTTLQYEPISSYSDSSLHNFKGYDSVYSYQLREEITKLTFLINNNEVSTDYAMMYNASISSNAEATVFDFMYYGLELCGFIIIIFAVVIGAGMVAGEQSSGTLKLLAIRPFSRNKILTSKILSTLIFATIFTIFTAIILFIMGTIFYGIDMTPVLGIFNSSTAFVMSPVLVLLIYLLCLIFKIFVYVLISITISVIFRSYVGAVGISIFIYFFSAIFGSIFTTSYWYAYLPFGNFDLFKYLGGSFAATESNPLSLVFSSGIFYNVDFWISAIITTVFILALIILTYTVFKKREIK